MELSPELIGAFVLALTGILSGFGGILSKRSKDQRDELDQIRKDYRHLREQLRLTDQWLYTMIRTLDQSGIRCPEPPTGLQILGNLSHDSSSD